MHIGFESKTKEQALAHIIEECGEVIMAFGKLHRFGENSYSPSDPSKQTNKEWLQKELIDLYGALDLYLLWGAPNGQDTFIDS